MQIDAVAIHLSMLWFMCCTFQKLILAMFLPTCYFPPLAISVMSCVGHFMIIMLMI